MSVRLKILLTIVVCVVALSAAIYFISSTVLTSSYAAIEEEGMDRDLKRAVDAIGEFSDQQMIKLADWAAWDEAYNYTKDRDASWPPTSIYPSSMANLDNNLAMFTDRTGAIFFIMVTDTKNVVEVDSASVESYFSLHPELVSHDMGGATQGIVMLPEGPVLIVSLPVLTAEGKGPVYGTLTFGRFLDTDKIEDLGRITHLNLSAFRYDATDLPPSVVEAKKKLDAGQTYVVDPENAASISGYALVKDVNGAPALILKVSEPRPVYAEGQKTLALFALMGSIALLAYGLIIIFLLERLVIARFVRLTNTVQKINDVHDLSIRVEDTVKDEVGMLAGKINQLLGWLGEAREAEASSRREIVNLLDELKKGKEQAEEMARILEKKAEGK